MNIKKLVTMILPVLLGLVVFTLPVQAEEDTFKVAMEAGYAPFNWTQTTDQNGGCSH